MVDPRPWTDAAVLARVLAEWRRRYAGRALFRVAAGDGWIRLHLEGDDRVSLLLTGLPGARLVARTHGRWPDALAAALPPVRPHPLGDQLREARLLDCGLLPDDKVAALRLATPGGEFVLLHRLFGARANSTLVASDGRLAWSVHRPPHTALAAWPPTETWAGEFNDASPEDYDDQALAAVAQALAADLEARLGAAVRRRLKTSGRLVQNLARDLDEATAGDTHRRKAEALAANLHRLEPGLDQVALEDLHDGSPLEIKLDPALPPAANMEAWFRRARKADKGREVIASRHGEAEQELATWQEADAGLEAIAADQKAPLERLAALQAWQEAHPDLVRPRRGRTGKHGPDEPARPFRRYRVDGKWEVWVGRSNSENDELTHRAAHNKDIWLHAQGVSGSHVILRTAGKPETVPRPVLEKAAALAALHSKAKHAGLVPVIHTEKRYVRKPRKSPPGTAVCLRDKSVFVVPGVGPGVEAF